jgi:hypothetical protein
VITTSASVGFPDFWVTPLLHFHSLPALPDRGPRAACGAVRRVRCGQQEGALQGAARWLKQSSAKQSQFIVTFLKPTPYGVILPSTAPAGRRWRRGGLPGSGAESLMLAMLLLLGHASCATIR